VYILSKCFSFANLELIHRRRLWIAVVWATQHFRAFVYFFKKVRLIHVYKSTARRAGKNLRFFKKVFRFLGF